VGPDRTVAFATMANDNDYRTAIPQRFNMSSMSFSTSKQYVRPPQRGIFPLDHDSECRAKMEVSA
jgi:hypothetical protein